MRLRLANRLPPRLELPRYGSGSSLTIEAP
jgi:hypothetical protein